MNKINVLYTTDHNYIKYMLVSLYSLLENNKELEITIHIICENFKLTDYKIIEKIIDEFKNANVYFYDFEKMSNYLKEHNFPSWRGSQIANARLFFTHYLKNINNLLYLDSDTVVVNSLSKLKHYNGAINMVQDSMPKNHWQNLSIPLEKYCNSGVFWINMNKWKEQRCEQKLHNTIKEAPPITYPDQDIINISLKDDITLLPPEYNLFPTDVYYPPAILSRFYKQSNIEKYSIKKMTSAKKNPIILHSTPFYHYRPLEENNIHPYSEIYNKYLYKLFGEINKEQSKSYPNQSLLKIRLYLELICPKQVKKTCKLLIKKSSQKK